MNAQQALQRLRETYKSGTANDLDRQLKMYSYFLDDEMKEKIQKAVEKKRANELLPPGVKELIDTLGWRIVDK